MALIESACVCLVDGDNGEDIGVTRGRATGSGRHSNLAGPATLISAWSDVPRRLWYLGSALGMKNTVRTKAESEVHKIAVRIAL